MQRVGRYEILDELGRGATGIVYRARDPSIGRLLAIKTIRLASLGDPEEARRLRERLRREAHSAGILSHPGIVVVYDVGQEGELAYIAMELVPGRSLEAWLKAGQPLDRQLILSVLRQAAAALDYAHKKGVVHRDIKPANILIGEDGAAKITDFGVAKISSSEQLTMTGTVLGTPNYMSPEQIQGKAVDGRADQFALAVIAYEILTGQTPFLADSLTAVLYKIVAVEPRAAHEVNPRLPWAASLVLGRALAKKPEDRYPSCGEFVSALERALESKQDWQAAARAPAEATATETLGRPIEQEVALPAERLSPAKARPRRRILAALLAGLGALAVGAAIYFGVEQWRSWSETGLPAPPGGASNPNRAPQDTTTCTVADEKGNIYVATPSGWGLDLEPGPTGIWLGTRLQSFNIWAGHPNCIQPGKRPRITLTPTLVYRDGEPALAVCVAGGDLQDQATLNVLLAHIDFGLAPQEAVDVPRVATHHHVSSFGQGALPVGRASVEQGIAEETIGELRSRGHLIEVAPANLGMVSAIGFARGRLSPAGEWEGMAGVA